MYLVELFWLEQCFLGKKPAASDKVVLGLLVAVLEVVTMVDTLAVPIPLPRHKLDAALGRMPRQHSITKVSEDAVVALQPCGLELRCALHRRHVFRGHGSDMDDGLQSVLRADAIHILLSVQHTAPSGNSAEVVILPSDGQVLILDALRLKAGVYQADFEFLEVPELRHVGLIVHFEIPLQKCEKPEHPVTLRPFKVMRFEYKKAPHSNKVRCLELVG